MIHRFLQDWAKAPWLLPDPGSGGTINVGQAGVLQFAIPTSGTVTRNLPKPSGEGHLLLLKPKTTVSGGTARIAAVAGAGGVLTPSGSAISGYDFFDNTGIVLLIGVKNSSEVLVWHAIIAIGITSF